jgi:hypothetical protein
LPRLFTIVSELGVILVLVDLRDLNYATIALWLTVRSEHEAC